MGLSWNDLEDAFADAGGNLSWTGFQNLLGGSVGDIGSALFGPQTQTMDFHPDVYSRLFGNDGSGGLVGRAYEGPFEQQIMSPNIYHGLAEGSMNRAAGQMGPQIARTQDLFQQYQQGNPYGQLLGANPYAGVLEQSRLENAQNFGAAGALGRTAQNVMGDVVDRSGQNYQNLVEAAGDVGSAADQAYGGVLGRSGGDYANLVGSAGGLGAAAGQAYGGALGQSAGDYGDFLEQARDPGRNPYLAQAAQDAADLTNRNLRENILPALDNSAAGVGQVGSSRHALMAGLAGRGIGEAIERGTRGMYLDAYNRGQQNYLGGLGARDATQLAGLGAGLGFQQRALGQQGQFTGARDATQLAGLGANLGFQQGAIGQQGQLTGARDATALSGLGAGFGLGQGAIGQQLQATGQRDQTALSGIGARQGQMLQGLGQQDARQQYGFQAAPGMLQMGLLPGQAYAGIGDFTRQNQWTPYQNMMGLMQPTIAGSGMQTTNTNPLGMLAGLGIAGYGAMSGNPAAAMGGVNMMNRNPYERYTGPWGY